MTLATYKFNLYIFIPHHMIVVGYYGFTFDFHVSVPLYVCRRGWLGETKVPCILIALQGIRLILAYSWARPVVLAAGMGKGGMFYFFCFFTVIHFPHSPLSLSFISSTTSSTPFLWETTQNDPQGLMCR